MSVAMSADAPAAADVPSPNVELQRARRIVVKVGSSLVTNEGRGVDADAIGNWCRQMAALGQAGREIIMVSSGAIAEGLKRLGWTARPKELHELQAAAAVGQMGVAQMYETKLREHGFGSAQILLTNAELADRERYLNARSTLVTLLGLKVIPVINENDTVVTDEIKFGDNDTLGALVANLVDADAYVILTDQPGLYSADPRRNPDAVFIARARAGDPELERMAGGAGSAIGRGGMLTKVLASRRAAGSGTSTVIAWGREPDVLLRLAAGEPIGTLLVAQTAKLAARKQWMVDHLQLRGAVIVDDGAATGASVRAALAAVRNAMARQLIIALPVLPQPAAERMARECDRLVTLRAPQRFRAVGQFYEEFPAVSEERVRQLLLEHQPAVEV